MNLSVGIVGLPNVGKSTLFNALLKKQQALAANYPFATIEPNVGIVPVPDDRLVQLAQITQQENNMPSLPPIKAATVEFVDIAGLVKGASEGAGLGNKFLSHIREVQIIAHVVRAFEDENVIREGSVDVLSDYETVTTELVLADLATISKIKDNYFASKGHKSKTQIKNQKEIENRIFETLDNGNPVRNLKLSDEERKFFKQLGLLTAKQEIVVLNVSERDYTKENLDKMAAQYTSRLDYEKENVVVICAKIEEELAALSKEDQKQYLLDLGIEKSGLERLIQRAYEKLGLISFLTAGEKEVRAWTIRNGENAVETAGEIHTDFMAKFIKAEIVSFDDFVGSNGWRGARANGKARLEGRDYIVQDGDVVEFKIGR